MKHCLLTISFLLLLASMASAQVLDSSSKVLPIYKGEKIASLDKFTGWCMQNDGEWVSGTNKIPNDRTVISPKSDEFKIGKDNISLMEMYLLTYDKKEYVLLAIYSDDGYYELPVLKSNWKTKKIISFYVFDKRKLYKLLADTTSKKPYSVNLNVWCSGVIDNVNRHTNLKNIASEAIIKTKSNIISNSSNLIFSLYPNTKDEKDKMYFKITKTYTKKSIYDYYLLPENQEKLFSRFYYEADRDDFDNFINTIISQGDNTNKTFGSSSEDIAKPWEQDTAELRFNIYKEKPLFEENNQKDEIKQDTIDFYNSKDKTESNYAKTVGATSFNSKKDYGKKHKITHTTTAKDIKSKDAIYRTINTTTSSEDDTLAIQKNNKETILSNPIKKGYSVDEHENIILCDSIKTLISQEKKLLAELKQTSEKLSQQMNKPTIIVKDTVYITKQITNNNTVNQPLPIVKENANIVSNNNNPYVNTDSIEAAKIRERLLGNTHKIQNTETQSITSNKKHIQIMLEPNNPIDTNKTEQQNLTKSNLSENNSYAYPDPYKEVKQNEKVNSYSNEMGAQKVKNFTKNQEKRKEVKLMTNYNVDEIRDTVLPYYNNVNYNTNYNTNKSSYISSVLTDPLSNKKKINLLIAMSEINTGFNLNNDFSEEGTAVSQGKIALDTVAGKVFYSIQIGCSSNMTSELKYRNVYNITERMFLFTYGIQYKYCVGVFKKYKDAAAHLRKVLAETKLPGAYIVSFVNGKLVPITVAKTKSFETRVPFTQVTSTKK
ncbi:MAG: hypothetical protein WCL51_12515 [Bacteroidota bacterium]